MARKYVGTTATEQLIHRLRRVLGDGCAQGRTARHDSIDRRHAARRRRGVAEGGHGAARAARSRQTGPAEAQTQAVTDVPCYAQWHVTADSATAATTPGRP